MRERDVNAMNKILLIVPAALLSIPMLFTAAKVAATDLPDGGPGFWRPARSTRKINQSSP